MVSSIQFLVNLYDEDGDIVEEGVWLCFDDTMVKVCEDVSDFDKVVERIRLLSKSVKETW